MKNKIIIILTVLLIGSCSRKNAEEEKSPDAGISNMVVLTEAQFKNAQITTGKLIQEQLSSTLKVNGKIDVPPQNLVSISMPLGGYLKSTKLLPGMPIKKGEVIALLEDQQYIQLQQDYLLTKSRLAFAEKEYERQKELNQTKASSDKVYQSAESEYRMLQINLNALVEKLKLININPASISVSGISRSVPVYSPINGFVSKVNVNIGKYVNPADVLFELINTSDIHLNLKVFEKDVDKIAIGQKLLAFSNNYPDRKYPCSILLISRDLSQDASVEVHCHFDKYDHSLLPGMYMNAIIETKDNKVQTLPEDAIVTYEGKNYAFTVKSSRTYEMLEVLTGISRDGRVEVTIADKRPAENLDFVLGGAYTLLMQLKNKAED
jgi:cobalt-zinc-cadmium efflux system membrane fusion protein